MNKTEGVVILENVRSAHNVGAIFRTAEAIGVAKIYLVGYTPAPLDRFGRAQPDVVKTALGADKMVPWEQVDDSVSLVTSLQKEGVKVVAVELADNAIDYKDCACGESVAFVFGNEIDGVSKEVLAQADEIIALPMNGKKESLNVSVTAGIVLYRLLDTDTTKSKSA